MENHRTGEEAVTDFMGNGFSNSQRFVFVCKFSWQTIRGAFCIKLLGLYHLALLMYGGDLNMLNIQILLNI